MRLLKKETYSLPPNGEEDRSFLFCRAYWTKRIDQTFFGAHLPSGNLKCAGHFVLFDPLKRDEFELVIWRSGTGETAKTVIVCPHCYNFPPVQIEEGHKGMTCQSCTVPHCNFSLARLAVAPCWNEACTGTLVWIWCLVPNGS
jgi:ssDNA-binding Zn-finger/Zn-ribbon topoisomerase 1